MNDKKDIFCQGKRILVVEDNVTVARIIENQIVTIGHISAGVASNGVQAIEMALSQKPDLILMDIEMPELDGIRATEIILDKYSVPIVILTSHDDYEFVEKACQVGAVAFLKKPPNIGEIQRAILMSLARHQDLLELQRINRELSAALDEIKTLQGIVPICTSCKKIRDDTGYWEKLEVYIQERTGAHLRHGLCPSCAKELYSDLVDDLQPYSDKDN